MLISADADWSQSLAVVQETLAPLDMGLSSSKVSLRPLHEKERRSQAATAMPMDGTASRKDKNECVRSRKTGWRKWQGDLL